MVVYLLFALLALKELFDLKYGDEGGDNNIYGIIFARFEIENEWNKIKKD